LTKGLKKAMVIGGRVTREKKTMQRRHFHTNAALIAAFVVLATTGCQFFGGSQEYVATVDGEKVPLEDFKERLEQKIVLMEGRSSMNAEQFEVLKRDVLNELIDEQVMLNRARRLGLSISEGELKRRLEEIRKDYGEEHFEQYFKGGQKEYRTWEEKLRRRLLLEELVRQEVNSRVSVSDEEVLDYLKQHGEERLVAERVHLSQMVFQDREKAEMVMQRLKNGEDFAALAREFSLGPEAERGGDLGYFARGVLPEAFDRVIFSLPPGKVSGIIETPYGYHIFKVLERQRSGKRVLAEQRELAEAKLKRDKEDREYAGWLERLRRESIIKINEPVLRSVGREGGRVEKK
jgi:parvulin-like peptidyl-prolyl isomerase